MRQAGYLAILLVLVGCSIAAAQSPSAIYTWNDNTVQNWQVWGAATVIDGSKYVPLTGTGSATVSTATGDLVIAENGTGLPNQGAIGGSLEILDDYSWPKELAPAKGNLDVTGLQYMEIDLRHNHPTGTVNVGFVLHFDIGEVIVDAYHGGSNGQLNGPPWSVGPGLNTIRFPLSLLPPRLQTSVSAIIVFPSEHAALGNLTWTISEVRTVGTPLAYRDIVTNNAGTPDDGVDGAFPLNGEDMLAIVGNDGTVSQLGLSRNPAGTGSLQWTDKGGTGASGSESGATIGWGNGAGWRKVQPGDPSTGNSYNERIADFSNYDRMTVRISAQDNVNPAGQVGIQSPFFVSEFSAPVVLPSQDLVTDGQYHDLVYDLSSVPFLKNIWHWGLDVAPHPNNIVFNIDNIRLWNSTTPQGVAGDYNGNGVVDAADYVLWRNGGALQNEGASPGSNTPEDYTFWRAHLGATSGTGAVAAANVPEPAALALLVLAGLGSGGRRRRA